MNKEEIIKEIISILDTSNYVDPAEHLYDGLKQIKREITYATVHDFLWALESSTVGDVDGKVAECANKIKPLLADMTIDESYEDYKNKTEIMMGHGFHGTLLSKEEFINKCKTNPEFSETWGLKIEERELSLDEELEYMMGKVFSEEALTHQVKIPTKAITITYNDKTIESYE
jgi:hypothetical protein